MGQSYTRGEHHSKGCAGRAATGADLKVIKLNKEMQPPEKQAIILYWLASSPVVSQSLQTGCCSAHKIRLSFSNHEGKTTLLCLIVNFLTIIKCGMQLQ